MATYNSVIPTLDLSHVKATSWRDNHPHFEPYYTFSQATSLTGGFNLNQWWSHPNGLPQRLHVDLNVATVIRRVYYENSHHTYATQFEPDMYGTGTGVKEFTLWGSNSSSDFDDLTYANDGTWTQLSTSVAQLDRHSDADAPDPKYFSVNNSTAYRYYAFKCSSSWGLTGMGVRRIEMQTEIPPLQSPFPTFHRV